LIEHNLEVIKTADWIVDLGPEGGDAGGHVVAIGTPEEIAANAASYTGQYLKQVMDRRRGAKAASGKRAPAAAE
jgi:excinuclease ABC subunit A